MNVTISLWAIPVALTVIIWAAAFLWPMPKRRGDYDFSGPIFAMFHLGAAVIATLVVWLIYFIAV